MVASAAFANSGDAAFDVWLLEFKREAMREGIDARTLETAFDGVAPNEQVVKLDRKQPEKTTSFSEYLDKVVTQRRIEEGRSLIEEHGYLLRDIYRQYGVPPEFIVALWGIETSYGNNTGSFSVIESLATLAYEGRRADLFRRELMAALRIMEEDSDLAGSLIGSWAGAMGNCQFMPSTYLKYAVDWDKDGHRDIWNSLPDTFASIANYLSHLRWDGDINWGGKVTVPADFTVAEADINHARPWKAWEKRGVRLPDGVAIADPSLPVYVIYPGKPEEGAYVITSNTKALLQWNRSRYFATAVGTLADAIR